MKKVVIFALCLTIFMGSGAMVHARNSADVDAYQTLGGKQCGFLSGCSEAGKDVVIKASGLKYSSGLNLENGQPVSIHLFGDSVSCSGLTGLSIKDGQAETDFATVKNGSALGTFDGGSIKSGCKYYLEVYALEKNVGGETIAPTELVYKSEYSLPVQAQCGADECSSNLNPLSSSTYEFCAQIKKSTPQYTACMSCFTSEGIWTAIGCIPNKPEAIIKVVITIGLSVGGGVVLIMILIGSFMLSVSQGDPNKTKEAREMITSAIIGLLFVIFSITILQFIGVSILHIPGFGE